MNFRTAALCSTAAVLLSSQAWAATIDFEVGAPPDFAHTTALTNTYSGLGVNFAGPAPGSGGGILDQGGNFGVNAHSGVDFLAFNPNASFSDGGTPTGPETISFDNPVSDVALWVGGTGASYTLDAFDGIGNLIDTQSLTPAGGEWGQITLTDSGISSLTLTVGSTFGVVDDLSWNDATGTPEPASWLQFGAGAAAVAAWRRRRTAF